MQQAQLWCCSWRRCDGTTHKRGERREALHNQKINQELLP